MLSVMKWSGSKQSQAAQIANYLQKCDTYYEPFCGGCNVLNYLISNHYPIQKYVASDINNDLISTYQTIQKDYLLVAKEYKRLWNELNKDEDLERKKEYFAEVRKEFNATRNPNLFYFIMRTCTNGMPRYNEKGDFNNSFHVTRKGMLPNAVEKLLCEWATKTKDVTFVHCPYWDIEPKENDAVYLDPPYANTKGMYYGTIDYDRLWKWVNKLLCQYLLSFDGIADKSNIRELPINATHHLFKSGNSSFRRVIGNSKDIVVYESLWVKNDI